jgi:hypothetical protein
MNENVYVNPAWNIGASKASQEFLVFLNDDVWCNPSINTVFNAHKLHEDKDGLFGLSTSCFQNKNPREVNEFEDIIIVDNEGRGTGWGCFFFIKREQWVPIPDELKIWCGDDFITHNAISKQRKIYSIKNVYVTPWSTTERAPEFSEIKQNDIKIFFNTN